MPACSAQEVEQSIKSYGHWGRDRSQSQPCWIFQVKQIHPSTASQRTTQLYPGSIQGNTIYSANAGSMLGQRRRRWPNIDPAWDE